MDANIAPTQMRSSSNQQRWLIVQGLVREFVRRIRIVWILGLLCCLVLPWLIFIVMLDLPRESFYPNLYMSFYGTTVLLAIGLSFEAQKGVSEFLSTRPVSTEFAFTCLLAIPIVSIVCIFIAANGIVQFVYGADWPWWRPILWTVFFACFAKCAYWRVHVGWGWEFLAAFGIGVFALACFGFAHRPEAINRPLSIIEVGLLVAATLVTVIVGRHSLHAIRTSLGGVDSEVLLIERLGWLDVWLAAFTEVLCRPLKVLTPPGSSSLKDRQSALEWLAWRQVGGGVLLLTGVMVCMSVGIQMLGSDRTSFPPRFREPVKLFRLTSFWFVYMCGTAGAAIGIFFVAMIRSESNQMSAFYSIRPVTNKEYWRVFGRTMFRYCVSAWLVLAAFVSVLPLVAYFTMEPMESVPQLLGDDSPVSLGVGWGTFMHGFQANPFYGSFGAYSVFAWLLFGFLVMWTCAGVVTAIVHFMNDISVVVGVSIGCFIVPMVASCLVVIIWPQHRILLSIVATTTGGIVALGATLWMFRRALREGFVQNRQIIGAVLLWVSFAVLLTSLVTRPYVFAAIAFSSLAAFGVAGGPVALAASRHR